MPQFYLKNGRFYIDNGNNTVSPLFVEVKPKNPVTLNGRTYNIHNSKFPLNSSYVLIQDSTSEPKVYARNENLYVSNDGGQTAKSKISAAVQPVTHRFTQSTVFPRTQLSLEEQNTESNTSIEDNNTNNVGPLSSGYKFSNLKTNRGKSTQRQSINWNDRFEDMKKKYQDKLYYLDMKGVDFSSADALQRSLNEKFKTNLVVDNKWGNKSQAALDLILANVPGEESQLTLNPIPVAPQQVQVASPSPFANISNPAPVNLDRGDIRSIFRHYGYDPYQFTGSLRKSFRKWLGGDRTQNIDFIDRNSNLYLDWVAPYTVFQSSAVDRFRRGGIVRKFLEGNKFNFIKAEDIFKKTTDAIKELDKKIQQVKKAASLPKKKSNNKVTTANTTAQLLLALYNAGMFDGIKKNGKQVSFELAVDGLSGNLTNQAIKNALKAGYNVDTNAGIITKNNKVTSQATNQTSSEVGLDFYDKISLSLRTLNNARELDIIEQFKAREESRNNEFRIPFNPLKRLMDNMYPYSYGDVLYNPSTRETIPYTGLEIQEGWKLTLNWPTHNSNDELSDADKDFFAQSALGKITNAMKGKDPRRTHMELLNAVDLNSPGGLDRYNLYVSKAPQGMIRISGDPVNDLFESRAREDAAVFYNNHRQKYNTWEVNPEYMSPTARARGEATYRIADPKQRERIYGEMVNWWLANKNKGHWNEDHTAYIVPSMGFMGNHSLVSDDEKGTNLRYGDWWDYVIDAPNAHIMYMGDRLVPEGSIPKYNPKYGRGHNSEHRTEDFEDLKERMLDKVAPNPNYFNTNYASMMRGH